MKLSSNPGINYGIGTTANVDKETGIHYGIISLHDLGGFAQEYFEPNYGDPTCPNCGNDAKDYGLLTQEEIDATDDFEREPYACDDYICFGCEYVFGSENAYRDEPICWEYNADGYALHLDQDNDVWIFQSPYYTYAANCSPCAPNAGHLNTPCTHDCGAIMTYCLDPSWFDNEVCPYPLYNVSEQLTMDLDASQALRLIA